MFQLPPTISTYLIKVMLIILRISCLILFHSILSLSTIKLELPYNELCKRGHNVDSGWTYLDLSTMSADLINHFYVRSFSYWFINLVMWNQHLLEEKTHLYQSWNRKVHCRTCLLIIGQTIFKVFQSSFKIWPANGS
jgi:hypothetical protein